MGSRKGEQNCPSLSCLSPVLVWGTDQISWHEFSRWISKWKLENHAKPFQELEIALPSHLWGALEAIYSSGGLSIPKATLAGSQEMLCGQCSRGEKQTGCAGLGLALNGLCEAQDRPESKPKAPSQAGLLAGLCLLSGAASSTCASSIVSQALRTELRKPSPRP